ncbi:hypothetical protein BD309DRAFT_962344 [Dichomitus squalens]|uniref:Uncharacterized protein n=1 Tax=Dichomitus squalens TaxID=114155 RepID=A0A4Q9PZD6_9APHY|nr:hypothetical protein BD309DRAFT_962344 [Dichomitus squalens]TBU59936.1 hypothetical protein BD310DRAFT_924024 [Dichomitus squalens]
MMVATPKRTWGRQLNCGQQDHESEGRSSSGGTSAILRDDAKIASRSSSRTVPSKCTLTSPDKIKNDHKQPSVMEARGSLPLQDDDRAWTPSTPDASRPSSNLTTLPVDPFNPSP